MTSSGFARLVVFLFGPRGAGLVLRCLFIASNCCHIALSLITEGFRLNSTTYCA